MLHLTRREALKAASSGFGYLAFSALATLQAEEKKSPLAPRAPHFPARAKRVIFLCMRGGPSHLDTFDYKPQLKKDDGKPSKYGAKLLTSPWAFRQRGESGLWISDLYPELSKHADDLCLLRGMHCDQPSHAQAFVQMHTGNFQFVRPSLGAWILYGLGTESDNLPGFISINPPTSVGGAQNYGSAFLPAAFQGTRFNIADSSARNRPVDRMRRGETNPLGVNHVRNAQLSPTLQRLELDLIQQMNGEAIYRNGPSPLVDGAIESFELAFRMQDAVPKLMDLSKETKETLDLYGIGSDLTDGFGRQCLLARRFAEAGVRFIELGHGSWDQHTNLYDGMAKNAASTDKPIAGLLADLKRRDLLKETLVIWGGEFGRTPHSDNGDGRDHNHKGYTIWMAGGGVKGGISHGSTDEYGYEAIAGKVHIHDWHATILHLLGLDHEKLTFRHAGRAMRLTDVGGTVVRDILA
jgi:hypothetical protein